LAVERRSRIGGLIASDPFDRAFVIEPRGDPSAMGIVHPALRAALVAGTAPPFELRDNMVLVDYPDRTWPELFDSRVLRRSSSQVPTHSDSPVWTVRRSPVARTRYSVKSHGHWMATMNCPRCAQPVPAGSASCGHCGLPLSPPRPVKIPIDVAGVGTATAIGLVVVGAGYVALATSRIAGMDATVVGLIEIACGFSVTVAIALFVTWFFMIRHNAGLWCPQRHSQSWSIVAWLVPVANLWYPYQIADDAWKASQPPGGVRRVSPMVIAWWIGCLLAFLTSFHPVPATWEMAGGKTVAAFRLDFSPGWSLANALPIAAAAGLGAWMVWSLSRMQVTRLSRG
jgi:hypothetical protein